MNRMFYKRKILKEHTRRELENKIAENVAPERGWKQISDIKEGYGNFQVLMEFTNLEEESK